MTQRTRGGRFFVPEVVQTSSMDCGPACLRACLLGFGIEVDFDRLREACQTDVDGTSLDALTAVAGQLGLRTQQVYLPLDHLTLREVSTFPALLVVRQPDGSPHMVVVWRRVGTHYQVMDPGTGRRWVSSGRLEGMACEQEMEVALPTWREWAGGSDFSRALLCRMKVVAAAESLIQEATADPSACGIVALDASVRFVTAVLRAGGLRRGSQTRDLVRSLFEVTVSELMRSGSPSTIPPHFFSALPHAKTPDRVTLKGAVLVRLLGRGDSSVGDLQEDRVLTPQTVAALSQPPARPFAHVLKSLRKEGTSVVGLVATAVFASSLLAGFETILLRGYLDVARLLGVPLQRVSAVGALLVILVVALVLQGWTSNGALALGRRLELRLRIDLFRKLPRLGDRYFRSRPASDMAHRAHALHPVRSIGFTGSRLIHACTDLVVTSVGLIWLDPDGSFLIVAAALFGLLVAWAGQSALGESDLRVRTYDGSLARFYLDALLGLAPIRAHGAERAVRWQHGNLVLEWAASARARLRRAIGVDLVQGVVSTLVSALLILQYRARGADLGATLLFVYWALNLPSIGHDIALLLRQVPKYRNLLLRVTEPLSAPEESVPSLPVTTASDAEPGGVEVRLEGASVRAAGRPILECVDLHVAAGEHVAIVGASGAGKSSLLGLLLGWQRVAEGRVLVDQHELDDARLGWLRRRTAWVDPSVMLWNRSLVQNIEYGAPESQVPAMMQILERAAMLPVLETLPDGLQTRLGESGALLSGGEGQRVRLARAMTRSSARLVVLDEPFRGLARDQRMRLLADARELWSKATLLCVTHDISETRDFDRVLVIEGGRIVEQGKPVELAARPGSRYRELLTAETRLHTALWSDRDWRKLRVEDSRVVEL